MVELSMTWVVVLSLVFASVFETSEVEADIVVDTEAK